MTRGWGAKRGRRWGACAGRAGGAGGRDAGGGGLGGVGCGAAEWGLDYAEPVVYGLAMRIVSGEPLYQPIDAALHRRGLHAAVLLAGRDAPVGRRSGFLARPIAVAGRRSRYCSADRRHGWKTKRRRGPRIRRLAVPGAGLCRPGPVAWTVPGRPGRGRAVGGRGGAPDAEHRHAWTGRRGRAGRTGGALQADIHRRLDCRHAVAVARLAEGAGAFFGSALLTFAIPCLALEVASNGAFLENTVVANVNPFNLAIAGGLLPIFLETQWLPLLLALVYLAVQRPWQTSDSRLLVLYWGLASVPLVLGIAKIGANFNYWIEFAAATAMLAARGAVWVMGTVRRDVAVAGAVGLLVTLGTSLAGPGGAGASVRTVRADIGAVVRRSPNVEFDALVDRVRREPGGVLAEPMDVVVLAGPPGAAGAVHLQPAPGCWSLATRLAGRPHLQRRDRPGGARLPARGGRQDDRRPVRALAGASHDCLAEQHDARRHRGDAVCLQAWPKVGEGEDEDEDEDGLAVGTCGRLPRATRPGPRVSRHLTPFARRF